MIIFDIPCVKHMYIGYRYRYTPYLIYCCVIRYEAKLHALQQSLTGTLVRTSPKRTLYVRALFDYDPNKVRCLPYLPKRTLYVRALFDYDPNKVRRLTGSTILGCCESGENLSGSSCLTYLKFSHRYTVQHNRSER